VAYLFTVGKHTDQAHEYTSALIDEAYRRKTDDSPTTPQERSTKAYELIECHWEAIERLPAEGVLNRLAWYVVFDEMTDSHPDKVTRDEYPIMSDSQMVERYKKESTLADVYTGKGDVTIGRRRRSDSGDKDRIYDYMTPDRDMGLVPVHHLELYRALDEAGLTVRQREAVDLVYFEGLTQELAAREMGVSRATLRVNINRSMAKLTSMLRSRSPL